MVSLWSARVWKSVLTTKLPKDVGSRSFSSVLHLTPRLAYINKDVSHSCLANRTFHTTGRLWLNTLFSETEQSKIINFVNKLPEGLNWTGKLRSLNKIAESLPETGPLTDVNDLIERYSLPTTMAVNLCNSILATSGDPSDLVDSHTGKPGNKKRKAPPRHSRKTGYLWRTVKPEISDPTSISSFTAILIAEDCIAYATLEREKDWSSQVLTNWDVCDISSLRGDNAGVVLNVANTIPNGEHFVIASLPTLKSALYPYKLLGMVSAILCAKNDFREDLTQKIFEMNNSSAARYFNLIVGNEVVSSSSMVSDRMLGRSSEADDHTYTRSLKEITFAPDAVEKYNASDDDVKESLCRSLLLSKAFVEILRL